MKSKSKQKSNCHKRPPHSSSHATMSQSEKLSHEKSREDSTREIWLTCDCKTAGRSTLFTCHRSGVDPRKMPVDPACGFPQTGGIYELTSWSPLLQKNKRATRRINEPQWMPSKPAFSGFASTMFQMASLTWPNPLEQAMHWVEGLPLQRIFGRRLHSHLSSQGSTTTYSGGG